MKNMGIVRGSKELAHTPFQICVDTVFLRFNPALVPPPEGDDDEGMDAAGEAWEYHEMQYTLREWLQIITEAVIDTTSFALVGDLVEKLENMTIDGEEGGLVSVEQTYIGLPEQKPFTFTTRFTQRRST